MTSMIELVDMDIRIAIFNLTYCIHMFKKLEEGLGMLGRNMADIKKTIQITRDENQNIWDEKHSRYD